MKLSLWYPAKPFTVSQAWGIYNPAYLQFGFSRHNGVDFIPGAGKELRAPIPCTVIETGDIPTGAGVFVRMVSDRKYEIGDKECYLGMMFMHCEKILVTKGQKLKTGELVAIADNTGFSTGPHTHMLTRRLSSQKDTKETRLDTDPETNFTFDPHKYWNKFHAADYGLVMGLYEKVYNLLALLVKRV